MKVRNLEHLKKLASNNNGEYEDFHIVLANGLARSSKRILYDKEFDLFLLINEIDDSYQEFTSAEIGAETNLLVAISANALIKD